MKVKKRKEEIKNYINKLVERSEKIHAGIVASNEDNMLCVTNDGRKVALDPRLSGIYVDNPSSKINMCVSNIFKEWKNGNEKKLTQLVFCDLGTPKSKSSPVKINEELLDNTNFNVYEDIRKKLINKGVPREQIAFIHEADTSIKRNELFSKMKTGEIRILIGSTSKMGEGMNVQQRLIAIHEIDCPWRPSDVGRILRTFKIKKNVEVTDNGKIII